MPKFLAVLAMASSATVFAAGAARPAAAGDTYFYGPADEREIVVVEREVPARVIERRYYRYYTAPARIEGPTYYYTAPARTEGPTYYYAGTTDGCGWLYRRAIRSGGEYWWNRYRQCAD